MYIKVTQYDKMHRAFVGDNPQMRVIGSFGFEVIIIRYINFCVFLYDDVHITKKIECSERCVVYMVRQ